MRRSKIISFCVFSLLPGTLVCAQNTKPLRPNIILILADDLGYANVGFNGATSPVSPNLDRLAKNGIIFSSAYVAHPVCGPSRAAIMTGRLPHKYGAQDNISQHHPEWGIPESETFIAKVLNDVGYFTGVIGKWHLGEGLRFQPNQRGFDEFYGFLGSGHKYFPERYDAEYNRQLVAGNTEIDENISPLMRNGEIVHETEYLTDAFSREAISFIDKAAKKTQPFFLYLAYNAPHAPIEAKEEDMEKFSFIVDKKQRTYAAMVYALDRGVGQVVDALKAGGLFDNTLIIFLSDNGGKLGTGADNAPLSGAKRDVLEGGIRVPMFFHWPNMITAGQRFDSPVLSLDFYPILAHLAGASIPKDKQIDGEDVWNDILAGRKTHPNEMIYAMSHRNGYTDASGRLNDWKVCTDKHKAYKLFNLKSDIGETHDLSKLYPERVREMVGSIEQWAQSHQKPRWLYDPEEAEQWKKNTKPYFDDTFILNR